MKKTYLLDCLLFVGICCFCGCASRNVDAEKAFAEAHAAWQVGDCSTAALKSKQSLSGVSASDSALRRAETATMLSGVDDYAFSDAFLKGVEDAVRNQTFPTEDRTLTEQAIEMAKVLANSGFNTSFVRGDYVFRNYERQMLATYRAFNALGQKRKARLTLAANRIVEAISTADDVNAQYIEAEDYEEMGNIGALTDGGESANVDILKVADSLTSQVQEIDPNYVFDLNRVKKNAYIAPFTYWVGGISYLNLAEDSMDLEQATDLFRLGTEVSGGASSVLKKDWVALEKGLKPQKDVTYLVYEGGLAPKKVSHPIKVPVPTVLIAYVTAYAGGMPVILPPVATAQILTMESCGEVPALSVSPAVKFDTIADLELMARTELANEMPNQVCAAVRDVVLACVIRGAAVSLAKVAYDNTSGYAQVAANVALQAAILYAQSPINLEKADERSWRTLPREVRLAKIKTPESGCLVIDGMTIRVPVEGCNIVRVRKASSNAKPIVQTFSFSTLK